MDPLHDEVSGIERIQECRDDARHDPDGGDRQAQQRQQPAELGDGACSGTVGGVDEGRDITQVPAQQRTQSVGIRDIAAAKHAPRVAVEESHAEVRRERHEGLGDAHHASATEPERGAERREEIAQRERAGTHECHARAVEHAIAHDRDDRGRHVVDMHGLHALEAFAGKWNDRQARERREKARARAVFAVDERGLQHDARNAEREERLVRTPLAAVEWRLGPLVRAQRRELDHADVRTCAGLEERRGSAHARDGS